MGLSGCVNGQTDFIGDLILRVVVEGPASSTFTRLRARGLHDYEPADVHAVLKNFLFGVWECPWCHDVLCPSDV